MTNLGDQQHAFSGLALLLMKQTRTADEARQAVAASKRVEGNAMPQSPHNRVAELHNLAAHANTTAAAAHDKGDHLTGHELSKQAFEHSMNAHKLSEELANKAAKSGKTKNA